LNYISEYYENLGKICKPLYQILPKKKKNPPPCSKHHTEIVKKIKKHVKTLPCLGLPSLTSFKIVETDASELGYGGILKQRTSGSKEQINVRYYSGVWNAAQPNYSIIKKEIHQLFNVFQNFNMIF